MDSLLFDQSYATLDELAASAAFLIDDSDSSDLSVAGGISSPQPSSFAPRQLFAPDADKADQSEQEKKARRRAQVASSSRRQRSRRKMEATRLRDQASLLESHLELLRSRHKMLRISNEAAEWEEKAITRRLRRRHAEQTNVALKASVYQYSRYLLEFRSVFSNSPLVNPELNLGDILHSYLHLSADPVARERDYLAICTNERLDLAAQIFARETAGLPVVSPSITTRTVRGGQGRCFGVTTVAAFAFETRDVGHIFRTACSAILDCVSEWPQHRLANTYGLVVDSPSGSIRYGTSDTTYQSLESGENLALQARSLSFSRLTDSCGVLLFDFVDADDLYPISSDASLRRDEIGGILVRSEVCEDGVERTVGRLVCSKLFGRTHASESGQLSPAIAHFAELAASAATVCGTRVFNAIRSGSADCCHVTV